MAPTAHTTYHKTMQSFRKPSGLFLFFSYFLYAALFSCFLFIVNQCEEAFNMLCHSEVQKNKLASPIAVSEIFIFFSTSNS